MLDYDEVMSREKDDIRAEWYNAGEGLRGDYDKEDPEDVNLLRFDIYRKAGMSWEPVDDASYCTMMPADTPNEMLEKALEYILKEYYNVLHFDPEASVKKLGEALSWLSPDKVS